MISSEFPFSLFFACETMIVYMLVLPVVFLLCTGYIFWKTGTRKYAIAENEVSSLIGVD